MEDLDPNYFEDMFREQGNDCGIGNNGNRQSFLEEPYNVGQRDNKPQLGLPLIGLKD